MDGRVEALTTSIQLDKGIRVTLRPIRPDDAAAERAFAGRLSPYSRYLRLFAWVSELSPEMVARFTQIDFTREMALVAVVNTGQSERQIGVARYVILPGTRTCEFAIVVDDDWHGTGVARHLMNALIAAARDYHHLEAMQGQTLAENARMIGLAHALGFEVERDVNDLQLVLLRRRL